MFLKTSRYFKQKTVETKEKPTKPGVKALTLRRLPVVKGNAVEVKSNYRLDIIAQRQYNDPTIFWHIADANTELQADRLVEETGRVINVPEQ